MKILNIAAVLTSAFVLSACATSGGGGGGGGGGGTGGSSGGGSTTTPSTPSAFDNEFSSINTSQAPTTGQISGTANFVGQMAILAPGSQPASPRLTNDDDTVIGDLEMTVDFAQGATNPVTARAHNFAGRVGGQDVTIGGELTTANHLANSNSALNIVATSSTQAPVVGTITVTSVTAGMEGTLTDTSGTSGLSGDVFASITGPTRGTGSDATSILGPVSVSIDPSSGPSISTGGSFWVRKQ